MDEEENDEVAPHWEFRDARLAEAGRHLEELYRLVSELGSRRYVTRRPIGQMHSKLLSALGVVKAYVGALDSWNDEERQLWLTAAPSEERSGKTP